jgi:competence protein ComEC
LRLGLHPLHGLAFALGASAVLAFPLLPDSRWIVGLLILMVPLAWRYRARLTATVAPAVLIGLLLATMTAQQRLAERLPAELQGQDLEVSGTVIGLPQQTGRVLRFDLRTSPDDRGLPSHLRLSWYEQAPRLSPGDCLSLVVRLKRPRGLSNPAGFDFERHALAANIGATGYVVSATAPTAECGGGGAIDALRAGIAEGIDETLPAGRIRATLKALAIGDTRELDERDWDLFRATGTSHLIAISGLHVGLAAAIGAGALWLMYWLWPTLGLRLPRPQAMALGALLSASAYAALAGFSLPTQRTLITMLALLAGVLTRRELGWWTRYALALAGVLLIDPLAPLSAGFWLSFGAVAWLILAFSGRWRAQSRWRLWLLPQLGLSVALLPLGLAFFQQASLAAPLVNLIAVPFVTLVVIPVLLAALLLWPWTWLSHGLMHLAAWLLGGFDALLVTAAQWPAARWALPAPDLLAWLLALLGTLWLLAPRGWPARALGVFGLLPLLLPARADSEQGVYTLTVLDVGQGQSVLIRTAEHALLIDTGPGFPEGGDLGDRVLVPSLVQQGVARLDRLIVSHNDLDHSGGTASLRRRIPVGQISASLPEKIPGAELCLAGEHWQWDGVEFSILHPPSTLPYLGNESSCVVRVSGVGGSALIPGDIGEIIEARLVREQAAVLDVDLLIAGHHGSAGSSSSEFLAAVSPLWVVYSAGSRNRFGFPREAVVERVKSTGAKQLNTADQGAIEFEFAPGKAVDVDSQRIRTRHWWQEPSG